MRHSEITKSPAQARNDILPAREGMEETGSLRDDFRLIHGQHIGREKGSEQERAQHQQPLEKVRPAYGGKAAEKSVADDDPRGQIHGQLGLDTDYCTEDTAGRLDRGSGIDGIGNQEDDRADHLKGVGL